MEIEINSGLEPLAAAVKEAADMNVRAARLQAESRASLVKGISDAIAILLPAIISGRSPARAFEPDAPEAETPAPAAEAIQPRPAAESGRSQGEAENPAKVTAENTSNGGAKTENPASACGSREARQVTKNEITKEAPIEKTSAVKTEKEPQEQEGAATPETQMKLEDFVNDTLAYCMSYLDELQKLPNFDKLDFVNAVCAVCGCKNPGEMQGSIEDVKKLRSAVAAVAEKFKKDGVYA